jgi:hypothetical protein
MFGQFGTQERCDTFVGQGFHLYKKRWNPSRILKATDPMTLSHRISMYRTSQKELELFYLLEIFFQLSISYELINLCNI